MSTPEDREKRNMQWLLDTKNEISERGMPDDTPIYVSYGLKTDVNEGYAEFSTYWSGRYLRHYQDEEGVWCIELADNFTVISAIGDEDPTETAGYAGGESIMRPDTGQSVELPYDEPVRILKFRDMRGPIIGF
jgi:hypothetical protein